MRTRRASYGSVAAGGLSDGIPQKGPARTRGSGAIGSGSAYSLAPVAKRARFRGSHRAAASAVDEELSVGSFFDKLPDDLLLSILACLSARADSPKELINVSLICKRFRKLAESPTVMGNASEGALSVRASQWCLASASFLSKCADAGNLEACFIFGLIRFYCLMDRKGGLEMLGRAATRSHAGSLHALAVIHFNGSGGGRTDKNLRAGVLLCARAAALCHVDAMRELGHCLQDGYGVAKNVLHGRRLILEANVREASASTKCVRSSAPCLNGLNKMNLKGDKLLYRLIDPRSCCSLLSDFGCSVLPPTLHIAHEFLLDWFLLWPLPLGLRLCSHANCGRPETRKHEFRRCSACGLVNYCSRACQALDWKLQHKLRCVSVVRWHNRALIGLPRVGGPLHIHG